MARTQSPEHLQPFMLRRRSSSVRTQFFTPRNKHIHAQVVPEPATIIVSSLLGGLGIAITYWRRKRRRNRIPNCQTTKPTSNPAWVFYLPSAAASHRRQQANRSLKLRLQCYQPVDHGKCTVWNANLSTKPPRGWRATPCRIISSQKSPKWRNFNTCTRVGVPRRARVPRGP